MQVAQLSKSGQVDALLALASELEPSFLPERPELAFELRRARFLQLLAAGDSGAALSYCRAHMAPLAGEHPGLGAQLKVGARVPAVYHSICVRESAHTQGRHGRTALVLP
jgi:hypothetical protein